MKYAYLLGLKTYGPVIEQYRNNVFWSKMAIGFKCKSLFLSVIFQFFWSEGTARENCLYCLSEVMFGLVAGENLSQRRLYIRVSSLPRINKNVVTKRMYIWIWYIKGYRNVWELHIILLLYNIILNGYRVLKFKSKYIQY